MKNEILNKPNQLIGIKADNPITTVQRKIYNVFLKVAQKEMKFSGLDKEKTNKNNLYWFEVDVNAIHKIAGIKIKDLEYVYEELKKLMGIIVTFRDEDNPNNWEAFSILPKIRKNDGLYQFALFGNVVEALKKQNYFTTLDLLMIKSLSSHYAVIFYELAIRYKKYKIPKMSIEEVREITNTQGQYKQFYNFRKRVLDPACEEISKKTDIKLSYTTEKKGRRISYVDFQIEEKTKLEKQIVRLTAETKELLKEADEFLASEPSETTQNNSKSDKHNLDELYNLLPSKDKIKVNRKILAGMLENHSFKYLKADIEYAKEKKPGSFIGYLKSSCQRCKEIPGECEETGGHYSSIKVEREELEKIRAEKRKIEEETKKKLEEKRRDKALVMAKKLYPTLSKSEKAKYLKGFKTTQETRERLNMKPISKKDHVIFELAQDLEKNIDLQLEDF